MMRGQSLLGIGQPVVVDHDGERYDATVYTWNDACTEVVVMTDQRPRGARTVPTEALVDSR
jgi:hypothetical protein